jgi:hypothetical protein
MEHLDTGVLELWDFGGAVVLDLQHHGAIVDHRNPAALASERKHGSHADGIGDRDRAEGPAAPPAARPRASRQSVSCNRPMTMAPRPRAAPQGLPRFC